VLEVPGESYSLLLDAEPSPFGDVVLQQAQTGARQGRQLRDDEEVRPGTTLYSRHSQTCKAKRKKPAEDQRELRLPYKESA